MHHLITAVASMMILMLFLSQFVANVNLFIETIHAERIINGYLEQEYDVDEAEFKMEEMKNKLCEIPNVKAELSDDGLRITINKVIGPSEIAGIEDNTIVIEKNLKLNIREEEDEEPDNNGGDTDIDGDPEPISDGDESDSASDDLD